MTRSDLGEVLGRMAALYALVQALLLPIEFAPTAIATGAVLTIGCLIWARRNRFGLWPGEPESMSGRNAMFLGCRAIAAYAFISVAGDFGWALSQAFGDLGSVAWARGATAALLGTGLWLGAGSLAGVLPRAPLGPGRSLLLWRGIAFSSVGLLLLVVGLTQLAGAWALADWMDMTGNRLLAVVVPPAFMGASGLCLFALCVPTSSRAVAARGDDRSEERPQV
jgi:hypothetical protein